MCYRHFPSQRTLDEDYTRFVTLLSYVFVLITHFSSHYFGFVCVKSSSSNWSLCAIVMSSIASSIKGVSFGTLKTKAKTKGAACLETCVNT